MKEVTHSKSAEGIGLKSIRRSCPHPSSNIAIMGFVKSRKAKAEPAEKLTQPILRAHWPSHA